jgi:hypothetical protein
MTEPMIEETAFTDELSDDALDREHGEGKYMCACVCGPGHGRAKESVGPVTER